MTAAGRTLPLACVAAALLSGCGGESGAVSDLPGGWAEGEGEQREAVEDSAKQLAEAAGSEIEVEAFYVDEGTADTGFMTSVNVLAEEIPDELDPAAYQEQSIGSLEMLGITDTTEAGGTEVGGESARVVEYSAPSQVAKLRFQLAVTVHDGTGYNFTLAASEAGFDEAVADFEEILASWEWSD